MTLPTGWRSSGHRDRSDRDQLITIYHRADLERIRGIGDAYIVLLEEVGVHSAQDLAVLKPEELRDRLNKVNEEKKLVGRIPALAMVNGWVRRAQYLTAVQELIYLAPQAAATAASQDELCAIR